MRMIGELPLGKRVGLGLELGLRRAFWRPGAGVCPMAPGRRQPLCRASEALALEGTAAAHCTKGAILQQLALAKGPDEASAVPADSERRRPML